MTNEEAIRIAKGLITDFKCESETMVDFCNTIIKALERTRWIPVSERLPEDRKSVLISTKTKEVFEGSYFDDNTNRQWYSCRDNTFIYNNVVTAWMPLPERYRT